MEKKKKKKKHKKKKKNLVNDLQRSLESDAKFSIMEVIVLVVIAVVFGVIIGYLITYGNSNLSRVRSDTNLGEIVSTYNNIVDNYYEDLDEEKLSESAIKGMMSSLEDPYSQFLDKDSTSSFNESVDGEYVGIGVTVEFKDEYNHVISLVKDGPAEKAGIHVGDTILSIDGVSCKNLYAGELSKLVTGKVGSTVRVTILRDGKEDTLLVMRQIIEVEDVSYRLIEQGHHKIGYIHLTIFSSHAFTQFQNALKDLEKQKIDSLIIDVRDNPGGHLAQARNILSLFFDKKTLLFQTESNGKRTKVYSTTSEKRDYPIVILMNQDTASSAEVLVASFQENYKNYHVVGVNSYGKSQVQKSLTLNSGSSIKFSIERWLTPSGKVISEKGLVPDILVEQSPQYYVDRTDENDSQLQKAISIIQKES